MKTVATGRSARTLILIGLIAAGALLAVPPFSFLSAQGPGTPSSGGTLDADRIAWENFVRAVTPSGTFEGKVAYETWASDPDIYVKNPCAPGTQPSGGCNTPQWPSGQAPKLLLSTTIGHDQTMRESAAGTPVVGAIGPAEHCQPPGGTGPGGAAVSSLFPTARPACVGEEVRRDPLSFVYIVQIFLWSQAGLSEFFGRNLNVEFPRNAVNVKADWIPVATLAAWIRQPESFVTANFYTAMGAVDPKEGGARS